MFFVLPVHWFFLNATVSPLANFFFTPARRYFLFEQTVPVKFVLSNNNYSAKGTALYQLSVKKDDTLDQVKEPLALYKCHLNFNIHFLSFACLHK